MGYVGYDSVIRTNFYRLKCERDVMAKELVIKCDRADVVGLQECVLRLMVELGLKIKVVPSSSKQCLVWEGYNRDESLGLRYVKKFEYGSYTLSVDVVNLDDARLKMFYEGLK